MLSHGTLNLRLDQLEERGSIYFDAVVPLLSHRDVKMVINEHTKWNNRFHNPSRPFNFLVERDPKCDTNVVVFNNEGVTDLRMLCLFLINIGMMSPVLEKFVIHYAIVAPEDVRNEDGGGFIVVDWENGTAKITNNRYLYDYVLRRRWFFKPSLFKTYTEDDVVRLLGQKESCR